MGGQRIQELAVVCNFVDRISAVMTVLNQSAAIMANGAAVSITATANVIPTVCNMVMAILSAKNLDGVLRAARMANRMAQTGHETSLDFIEDSVDLAISLDEFGKSKASFVDKALNAGMYAKVLNYSFDYTSLQRASSLNRETGVVANRQTQLIDDMKTNNTCTELTAVGKAEAASKAKKRKGETEFPNGLILKDEAVARHAKIQQKALAVINGGIDDKIKIMGHALMGMIQLVENRGTDALEVSGGIIRRILDSESPYPAVGYNFEPVTAVLSEADGETRFEANDFCDKHDAVSDTSTPSAKAESEAARKHKCEAFKKKIDMSHAVFSTSPKGIVLTTTACNINNKKLYKLANFEAANVSNLANPHYDPLIVSSTAQVCGSPNMDAVQIDALLAGVERAPSTDDDGKTISPTIYSDQDAAADTKKQTEDMVNTCVSGASEAALKRFNSIQGFGPSADNAFEADWKQQVGCQPRNAEETARTKGDLDKVSYQQFSKNFSTVGMWRKYYNEEINSYISRKYKGIADTGLARAIRGVRPEDALAPADTSYGQSNKWNNTQDTWNNPTSHVRALKSELGLISLCSLPSTLKRLNRDNEYNMKTINGEGEHAKEDLLKLIASCRNTTEGQVDQFVDIFNRYIEEIGALKMEQAEARQNLFATDVIFGAYTGLGATRKQVECTYGRSQELSAQLLVNIMGGVAGTLIDDQLARINAEREKLVAEEAIKKQVAAILEADETQSKERERFSTTVMLNANQSVESKFPPAKGLGSALEMVGKASDPSLFVPSR